MTPAAQRIADLHAWYCRAMGTDLALNPAFERYWFDWLGAGYNGPQLRRVMIYIRREISYQRRNPGALKLSNLLNIENFGQDLLLAGADLDPEKRLPALPESERARASQPVRSAAAAPLPPARNPAAEAAALADVKKFRESLR